MSLTPQEKIRPKPLTPLSGGQMSSSLKNKLKRCGRYHTSTPAKKVCPNTLTIDSSPILPTQHLEPSNVSCESLQLKQNDSLSVICEVQENDSPVGLGTSNRSKSVTGHVCSLPSPAAPVFSQSQYSVMNARSSFISPVNKTISGTPSSSKRNRRRLIRSTKLNFDKSDLKTNVESKDDEPKLDLNVGEQSLSKPSCSTNLNDVSQLMAGNKKEFVCNTFTYEKESSTVCGVLKSKIPKDVSSQSQQLVISKQTLLQEIKEKKETLRKLKMVKMYRSKNNLSHLQTLIDKWRDASQQSLQDLLGMLPEPKPSMSDLLQHLQIEQELVNFDSVEEAFT